MKCPVPAVSEKDIQGWVHVSNFTLFSNSNTDWVDGLEIVYYEEEAIDWIKDELINKYNISPSKFDYLDDILDDYYLGAFGWNYERTYGSGRKEVTERGWTEAEINEFIDWAGKDIIDDINNNG